MSERRRLSLLVVLDRATLVGIGVGILWMLSPFWDGAFRQGFFVTLAATAAQVVTSHLAPRRTA